MLQPSNNKTDTSGISGEPADPHKVMELLLRLQATLDVRRVVTILAEEIEASVAVDGVVYHAPDGDVLLRRGRQARNATVYRLRTDAEEHLGELRLSRSRALTEADHHAVHRLLGLGHLALRNALKHHLLQRQVRSDPLTGLCNRAAFDERLMEEMELARRHGEPLALLVADIDAFKGVNDRHGHLLGDRILGHVANIVRREARSSDLVFRYGGDEFVVCARRTDHDGALRLRQRLRDALAAQPLREGGEIYPVSLSIGAASLCAEDTPQSLFARADMAMYAIKAEAEAG
jgi:diguanylate cyclase (GGDEF)-like protein